MGIIPTRVGTSLIFPSPLHRGQDHPHACGDKCFTGSTSAAREGSSPRVWGQERNFKRLWVVVRIIPTRVGTSHRAVSERHSKGDHPHACGDKAVKAVPTQEIAGSSPRVWGQAANITYPETSCRIIPTRVGTR